MRHAPLRSVAPLMLLGCALAAVAALTASCDRDKDKNQPQAGPGAQPSAAPHASAGKKLSLFCWDEYIPEAVLKAFTTETGIEVVMENYDTNEAMMTKVKASPGGYDVVFPSDYAVELMAKEALLAPLDHARLPNRKHLAPEAVGLGFDPQQKHSVPWMMGTVGIVINAEKVREPVAGYRDLFSAKYSKRIIVPDDSREMVTWAAATLGIKPNAITKADLARVRPVLEEWVKHIKVYDSDSPSDKLREGNVDLGIVWNGEAAKLIMEDKAKWRFVLPAEGPHRFIDNMCIPAGAPDKEAAHRFIDYLLRPEVAAQCWREHPYTTPNTKARELLSPEERANPAAFPAQTNLETFRDVGSELLGEMNKLVEDVKSKAQ